MALFEMVFAGNKRLALQKKPDQELNSCLPILDQRSDAATS